MSTSYQDALAKELIEPRAHQLTYEKYLQIHTLTSLQNTLSQPEEHDEHLFIVIHQVYELWFKQILNEVEYCFELIKDLQFLPLLRCLKRITTIQKTLVGQIDVLETMTPNDFNRFRNILNPASGFQSFQFRLLEFKLGSKNEAYLKFHKEHAQDHAKLFEALRSPSFYDEFLRSLSMVGFAIDRSFFERDYSIERPLSDELAKVFVQIYQESDRFHEVYLILESLADLDEGFLLWRFRHVAMVSRMIGMKRGTGGSSGAHYLTQTLEKRFFPEIWHARNFLNSPDG